MFCYAKSALHSYATMEPGRLHLPARSKTGMAISRQTSLAFLVPPKGFNNTNRLCGRWLLCLMAWLILIAHSSTTSALCRAVIQLYAHARCDFPYACLVMRICMQRGILSHNGRHHVCARRHTYEKTSGAAYR